MRAQGSGWESIQFVSSFFLSMCQPTYLPTHPPTHHIQSHVPTHPSTHLPSHSLVCNPPHPSTLARQVNAICVGSAVPGQGTDEATLLANFRDDNVSNMIVMLLRFITGAEIQARQDHFSPFVLVGCTRARVCWCACVHAMYLHVRLCVCACSLCVVCTACGWVCVRVEGNPCGQGAVG